MVNIIIISYTKPELCYAFSYNNNHTQNTLLHYRFYLVSLKKKCKKKNSSCLQTITRALYIPI